MAWSLRRRLLSLASLLLLIGFGITAFVLDSSFRSGTEQGLQEKMQLQILTLLAAAEHNADVLMMPDELPDPRFNQPSSGLYGFILDSQGHEIWRSMSAIAVTYSPNIKSIAGVTQYGEQFIDQSIPFFYASLGTLWEQNGVDFAFTFIVMEDKTAINAANQGFRSTLWLMLGSVAIALLLIQWFVLRWGLSPLAQISDDLKHIELQQAQQLSGHYPKELQGLAVNINQLLISEQNQRERYKHRMADLAHSLKTPLAIIKGIELKQDPANQQLISQQADRMNQIVEYQLKRAVMGSSQLSMHKLAIKPLVEQIINALVKVYKDKKTRVLTDINADIYFRGDDSDFMEMAANLLDNAFKYGVSQVRVSATNDNNKLIFIVEDDGSGVNPDDFDVILSRGTRLDTQEAGQGLGLASVAELVSHYQGNIKLEQSSLYGAKFVLTV